MQHYGLIHLMTDLHMYVLYNSSVVHTEKLELQAICSDAKNTASGIIFSLVPRPPPFLPSVSIHNNTWEWKTEKAWEHSPCTFVSGHEGGHRGGGADIQIYTY